MFDIIRYWNNQQREHVEIKYVPRYDILIYID